MASPHRRGHRTRGIRRIGAAVAAATASGAMVLTVAPSSQAAPPGPIDVQLLNITDIHGYIRPHDDTGNGTIVDPDGNRIVVGGGPYLSAHLDRLSKGKRNSFRFTSGDSFSGWPAEVAWHRDEPTIEFFNHIGLLFNNVGNHELDVSESFLVDHMWKGKCFGEVDVDSCFTDSRGKKFHGSNFPHSTANIVERDGKKLITPPYVIEYVSSGRGPKVPIGFINLTTEAGVTETMSYQPHLEALPMVETANKYAAELRRKGVEAIVVSVHEGGSHDGHYDNCVEPRGPVIELARQADPSIDAIFAGHWHSAFNCVIDDPAGNPRPVVEAGHHGKLLNETNLRIDPRTKDVIRTATTSVNHPVTRDIAPDPAVERMVEYWMERKEQTEIRPVATIGGDLDLEADDSGETTLGNAVADAMYADSQEVNADPADRADLAVVPTRVHTGSEPFGTALTYAPGPNPADEPGLVMFGEWMTAFGYGNPVVTATVTGQNIHDALEGQWRTQTDGSVTFAPLAVSANVRYSFDGSGAVGDRVDPEDVLVDGEPLDLERSYRIAGLTYNLYGRDGTAGLSEFTDPVRGTVDRYAFEKYLVAHPDLQPPALDRVSVE
ncbi:MAG TPA: bifunctional metallophosphatase/5'-nucleotidase [Actinopolymorphaceae bacterium]